MSRKTLDLKNKRFGRLVALERTVNKKGISGWICKCDCGNEKWVETRSLTKGITKSCGCICTEIIQNARKKFVSENMVEGTSLKSLTRKTNKNNTSGIKGVCFSPAVNKYVGYITFKGKKHTKFFYDIKDAIRWREKQEEKYFKPLLDKYENG